ncbi:MAG: T9SS type A sorting domain-containing protein [Bacteroidetes bacterium]|nr:T9SS type A sorting domain-containing protein [Bacteroidota bacterium]
MKKIITILFLFAFILQIKSQTLQEREKQFKQEMIERDKKALIKGKENATLIAEGTVIKCDEYYNKAKSAKYLQYSVKIKYVLKGSINDSIVEVIKYHDQGDEIMPLDYNIPLEKNLPTGYDLIFYGNPSKSELYENLNPNKSYFDIYYQLIIFLEKETNRVQQVAQYDYLIFMSKKELYDGLNLYPPNYKPFVPTEAKTSTKEEYDALMKKKYSKKKEGENVNKSLASGITFSFQNAVTTGTSTQKYYEFDVAAFASNSNSYLDFVQVDIDYAPAAFGNSVVTAGNVTVTQVPTFPAANYPTFLKFDNNTNILRIVMAADFSTPNRMVLPTTITNLFHVKIAVNCNQNVNLSFTGATGGADSPSATSPSFTNYSPVNDNDFDGTIACALNITGFSPSQINGGRGEILTINGVNFGATQGSGFVKLKNANNGGNTFIQLDADDYISWTNTQIKIVVPSYSRGQGTVTAVGSPVGTGVIQVSNGTSTVSSAGQVNVFFSHLNYNEPAPPIPSGFTYRKERVYSTGNPPSTNLPKKYPIKIDSASCAAFPGALACIKKAIAYWVCETKIPFIIVGDTTFASTIPTDNSPTQNVLNGVSTIRFSTFSLSPTYLPGPNAPIGATFFRARRCDTLGSSKVIGTLPEFDIEFDLSQSWFCDTNVFASKPANMYDFYEVALHELGHANLLKHNNASNTVMWYGSVSTPSVSFGARRIFLQIPDYLGGSQIINDSKNLLYAANCSFLPVSPESCTGIIGIKEFVNNDNDIIVQPNPFGDNLLISVNIKKKANLKISVYDMLGKTVKKFEEIPNALGETKLYYEGADLNIGVYFVKIQINESFITRKVIKQ